VEGHVPLLDIWLRRLWWLAANILLTACTCCHLESLGVPYILEHYVQGPYCVLCSMFSLRRSI